MGELSATGAPKGFTPNMTGEKEWRLAGNVMHHDDETVAPVTCSSTQLAFIDDGAPVKTLERASPGLTTSVLAAWAATGLRWRTKRHTAGAVSA